jgi:hypothetical protein
MLGLAHRVEILNEPAFHNNLHNFQLSTLATLRNICGPDFPLVSISGSPSVSPATPSRISSLTVRARSVSRSFEQIVSDSWQLSHCLKTYFPTTTFTVIDNHVYRAFTVRPASFSAPPPF